MPGKKPIPWTAGEIALLGKVPDSVLARRTGRTIKAVVAEREQRAIALPLGPRRWTTREIRMLESRLSSSEGGGADLRSPYPYSKA